MMGKEKHAHVLGEFYNVHYSVAREEKTGIFSRGWGIEMMSVNRTSILVHIRLYSPLPTVDCPK